MIIPIASDHAGFTAKQEAIQILKNHQFEVEDFGPFNEERVDYPDFAIQVSKAVNEGTYPCGILVCGSGQGMCMTANKYENIRAALVYNHRVAALTKQHNNANIICLPGRELDKSEIEAILLAWLNATFEGGRHTNRVEKIKDLTR